jgi:hypothetical protein
VPSWGALFAYLDALFPAPPLASTCPLTALVLAESLLGYVNSGELPADAPVAVDVMAMHGPHVHRLAIYSDLGPIGIGWNEGLRRDGVATLTVLTTDLVPADVLRDIVEVMYPGGDVDAEWSPDTLDEIAGILDRAGLGPGDS